jgi:hypothetical protein
LPIYGPRKANFKVHLRQPLQLNLDLGRIDSILFFWATQAQDQIQRAGIFFYVQPVTHVASVSIDTNGQNVEGVEIGWRDELFRNWRVV